MSLIERYKDQEFLGNEIEKAIAYHNEILEIKLDNETKEMSKYVAQDILENDPSMLRHMGLIATIQIWLSLVFHPQRQIVKMSAIASLLFPMYLSKYKEEYRQRMRDEEATGQASKV
jgi:hypothetical protein